MNALIDQAPAQAYELVQIEGIEMAPYGLRLLRRRADGSRPALVFDNHNCEYLLQKRNALSDLRTPSRWIGATYSLVQWQKLRLYERRVANASDLTVAVSGPDAQALARIGIRTRIAVVPNGINAAAYAPLCHRTPDPNALLFIGKMDYRPNVDAALWFAHNVLPLIRREVPDARFWIVGQNPHPRLASLPDDAAVVLTGWVEDVRPYIAAASVYVVPLRIGGGTRLKILEAMAMGKAMVSTTLGCEGFEVVDGQELLIADEPSEFAAAVLQLLRQPATRERLGRAARRFAGSRYDWRMIVPKLERLL